MNATAVAPLVVVDRPQRLAAVTEETTSAGWADRGGLGLPERPWDVSDRRWLCRGDVVDLAGAALAVDAAARGAAVVVACVDGDVRSLLIDDLRRVGPVALEELGPDPLDVLDEEQRSLLGHLARGASIAEAAAALFLSPRTAERRVAAIRGDLGVRTTAEAIALWSLAGRGDSLTTRTGDG